MTTTTALEGHPMIRQLAAAALFVGALAVTSPALAVNGGPDQGTTSYACNPAAKPPLHQTRVRVPRDHRFKLAVVDIWLTSRCVRATGFWMATDEERYVVRITPDCVGYYQEAYGLGATLSKPMRLEDPAC